MPGVVVSTMNGSMRKEGPWACELHFPEVIQTLCSDNKLGFMTADAKGWLKRN